MRASRPGGISSRPALAGDDRLQLGVEVERLEAVGAALQVGADDRQLLGRSSRRRGTPRAHAGSRCSHVSHGLVPRRAGRRPASPRAWAYSNNDFCIAFLPRWSRDITVPIGMSSISAISLYEKPSTSASSTGRRKFSGRSSSACLTSSSVNRSNSWSSAERLAASVSRAPSRRYRYRSSTSARSVSGGRRCRGAVGVDEGVGEDAVQPGPQVGALGEAAEAAVGRAGRSPGRGPRRRPGCGSCAGRRSTAAARTASPGRRTWRGRPRRRTLPGGRRSRTVASAPAAATSEPTKRSSRSASRSCSSGVKSAIVARISSARRCDTSRWRSRPASVRWAVTTRPSAATARRVASPAASMRCIARVMVEGSTRMRRWRGPTSAARHCMDEEVEDVELHRIDMTWLAGPAEPAAELAIDGATPQQLPGAPEAFDRTGPIGRRRSDAGASHRGHACHPGMVANCRDTSNPAEGHGRRECNEGQNFVTGGTPSNCRPTLS